MDKHEYDIYRQGIADQTQALYDKKQAYANGGVLTSQALEYFIFDMATILANFKAFTDSVRRVCVRYEGNFYPTCTGSIDPEWLNPRFDDQYGFWATMLEGWRRELSEMYAQAAPVAASSPSAVPSSSFALRAPVQLPGATVNVSTVATLPEPPGVYYAPSGDSGGGGEMAPEVVEASMGGGGVSGAVLVGGLVVGLLLMRRGRK